MDPLSAREGGTLSFGLGVETGSKLSRACITGCWRGGEKALALIAREIGAEGKVFTCSALGSRCCGSSCVIEGQAAAATAGAAVFGA